jgi:hypothetical protein
MQEPFLGSVYIEFKSNQNLAVPFCAVMVAIKSKGSVCALHTYGRRLEEQEIGSKIDLTSTKETGWTLRDSDLITSFSVLHNGRNLCELSIEIEVQNSKGEVIKEKIEKRVEPFGTILIIPKDLFVDLVNFLGGSLGHAKLAIDGLSGIFPRMLCGNFLCNDAGISKLNEANEIQFTHTNFDFDTFTQPDSAFSIANFNQPDLPSSYAIFYPIKTKKYIEISAIPYISGQIYTANLKKFSQTQVVSTDGNLPSRLVGASVGRWPGSSIESECSTGIFTQDYLNVKCHWHWGLLKPGFETGTPVISIHKNQFDDVQFDQQVINLRLYDESGLIEDRNFFLSNSLLIKDIKLDSSVGAVWYVLSGEKLEDLHIFSTFYPKDKSGFCEHAF